MLKFGRKRYKARLIGRPFDIRNLLGWTITALLSSSYLDKKPHHQIDNIDARNTEQSTRSKLVEKLCKLEDSTISSECFHVPISKKNKKLK